MAYFKVTKKQSGGGGIANILKGTSNPTSSIGDNGQMYLKYAEYEKHSFMSGAIVIVEDKNNPTDIKLYIDGLTKDSNFLPITDTDLLAYLSDIPAGYLKACSTYDTATSTTVTGLLAIGDWGSGMMIGTYITNWSQYKAGTFYGVIDLNQSPVPAQGLPAYQDNSYVDPDTLTDGAIIDSFAKVGGAWQDLIGTVIDDILSGGSKYIQATGSFTSGTSSGAKVEVNCGFKPDLVMVDMEFGNGFTRATYLSTAWYEETDHPISVWDLRPMENVIYAITPGSVGGETGITDLTDTGFKYRSNGWNTQNKACTYTAIKFDVEEQVEPIVYKNYAKFDGSQGIILPWKINADYKVEVTFYQTEYTQVENIIGNTAGASYSHLTPYQGGYWSSSGSGEGLIPNLSWSAGEHTYITNNGNDYNEFDGVEVQSYTPTTIDGYYTIGSRINTTIFKSYLKSYKIYSISRGTLLHELVPCLYDGVTSCLYDKIGKMFFCNGIESVMDTIPTT